jgi:hypothetical protein
MSARLVTNVPLVGNARKYVSSTPEGGLVILADLRLPPSAFSSPTPDCRLPIPFFFPSRRRLHEVSIQRGVDATQAEQLGMSAAFHDAAVVEDEHLIDVPHGAQPVGDHEAGASA